MNDVNLMAKGIFVFTCVSYFDLKNFFVFWAVSVPVAFSMVCLSP